MKSKLLKNNFSREIICMREKEVSFPERGDNIFQEELGLSKIQAAVSPWQTEFEAREIP